MRPLRSLTEEEAAIWSAPIKLQATVTPLSACKTIRRETSWRARDLSAVLDGNRTGPIANLLLRSDGTGLLYPGRTHAFVGEPESGKSWLALLAIVQAIESGGVAILIDFEDDEHSIVARLVALGASSTSIIERFRYLRANDPLEADEELDLTEELSLKPAVVILDGVTEALTLHGWSGDSGADVADFHRRIVRRIADAGPAVVLVDHVVKSGDARGRWATGSQHKLAGLDGAQYVIERRKPWAQGHSGWARITVAKDRPGAVRANLPDLHTVGDLVVTCGPDARVDLEIRPANVTRSAADGGSRPTLIMERCSAYLAANPSGQHSGNAIRAAVHGDDKAIDRALILLGREGFLDLTMVGRARYHHHVKTYSVENDQIE